MLGQKHFLKAKMACFEFSPSIFILPRHILSAVGAALSEFYVEELNNNGLLLVTHIP
jgi:hypothetical protein